MFPPFEKWCDEVLHPDDTSPWNFRTKEFYDEYRTKYAIAKLVQPKRILEVGVRFGYSARSFLFAAPEADYFGLDIDEPSWGAFKGVPRLWAEERLKKLYPKNKIQTWQQNSQEIPPVTNLAELFDLVHIDADHTYEGALHDMERFWPACRHTMVVDDYLEVMDSVSTFSAKHNNELVKMFASSLRSSALLVRV